MLFAVIDVGSNAARLLFANAYGDEDHINVEKATLIRIPIRLGKDVFDIGKVSKEKEKDFLKTMKAFKLLIDVYQPLGFRACATAAMREATNSARIVKKIQSQIGINLEVISGSEEASIIRNTNRIVFKNPDRLTFFIDVGGGSTEISVEKNQKLIKLRSFKIGTIRLLNNNFDPKIWQKMHTWLNGFKTDFDLVNVVGSGGNINKISKLFGKPNDIFLSVDSLNESFNMLSGMSLDERMDHFGMREDRADVIVPAMQIYLYVMNTLKAKHIAVPKIGLADGMIHTLYKKHLQTVKKK
jgi:exopolyphosphatase/guanosine-5'-triphosphate,3'-diphosphate pyrophosphatase